MATIKAFGEPQCEREINRNDFSFDDIFFRETPFNVPALDPDNYLVVGRRGSGKTALTNYFGFQDCIPGAESIVIQSPKIFERLLTILGDQSSTSPDILIPRLTQMWEFFIWEVASRQLMGKQEVNSNSLARLIITLLPKSETETGIDDISEKARKLKSQVLQHVGPKRNLIISIDTLERYDIRDNGLMCGLAALVQTAEDINFNFSSRGVHIKVFIAGEVFPHLHEVTIQNPAKSIRSPVHLLWRPRDLLRLICWRYVKSLTWSRVAKHETFSKTNWDQPNIVLSEVWNKYFGTNLINGRGKEEKTWPYVLRHTQMRPRQLIMLCNRIAEISKEEGTFPAFSRDAVVNGVRATEVDLAKEIISSYSLIYPKLPNIVDCLKGMPMLFRGNELDKRSKETTAFWPDGYSLPQFRDLLCEIGIVGLVRSTGRDGFVSADFSYSLSERLTITPGDTCVIHPMFYYRLSTDCSEGIRVIPFSSEGWSDFVDR
jgi:hypothetical protein